jgi:hypothetical protein
MVVVPGGHLSGSTSLHCLMTTEGETVVTVSVVTTVSVKLLQGVCYQYKSALGGLDSRLDGAGEREGLGSRFRLVILQSAHQNHFPPSSSLSNSPHRQRRSSQTGTGTQTRSNASHSTSLPHYSKLIKNIRIL